MEKLAMWLLVLIAVMLLARPQGAAAVEKPQYIASTDCADEGSDSGSIILTVVIIVIIIGAVADACGLEKT
ncbi:MAG: hypothetical protein K2N06_03690 [Oscillospiraceae bacterium]|nr:hypothetical protein [Oscillospiraceae bacterium]